MTTRPDWGDGGETRGALVPSNSNGALGPVSYGGNDGAGDAFAGGRGRGNNWLALRDLLPAPLVQKWAAGMVRPEYKLAAAVEAAHAVVRRLFPDVRHDFVAHFEASLSEAAKSALIDELAAGGPGNCRSATKEQIDDFARGSEAAARAVKSWSGCASRNVGRLLHRTERLRRAVSGVDFEAIDEWLRHEPDDTRYAIYMAMAE